LMSHDEAGALTLNIAKLPELLRQPSTAEARRRQTEGSRETMTRWGEVIDNVRADLETETPGAEGSGEHRFRVPEHRRPDLK
jgi:hypothetical protein